MTRPQMLMSASILALAGTLAASRAEAVCACTQMRIHTTASPQTLCSDQNLNFAECTKTHGLGTCAAFTYGCPVGSNNYSNKLNNYGFVAEAQIAGGSNLDECTKGQGVQLTITSNMGVTKPKIAYAHPDGTFTIGGTAFQVEPGNGVREYPDVGTNNDAGQPKYGADNYSNPNSPVHLIQWSNDVLKWWDNPDQTKDKVAEAARWQYRFVSFVEGSAGQTSCACFFDIDVNWASRAALPVTAIGMVAGSTNCLVQ